MKKTVEVEYVGIEDVHDIIDDVAEVIKLGHYASVQLNEVGGSLYIAVYIMIGGFDKRKEYDYQFSFALTDSESDIKKFTACRNTLKNLQVVIE